MSNANSYAVTVEVPIGRAGQKVEVHGDGVVVVDGTPTWSQEIAPGSRAQLQYRF